MVHQWGFFGSISAIRKIWSLTANSRSLQAAALKFSSKASKQIILIVSIHKNNVSNGREDNLKHGREYFNHFTGIFSEEPQAMLLLSHIVMLMFIEVVLRGSYIFRSRKQEDKLLPNCQFLMLAVTQVLTSWRMSV